MSFFSPRYFGKSRAERPSVSEAKVKKTLRPLYHLIATNKLNMQGQASQNREDGRSRKPHVGRDLQVPWTRDRKKRVLWDIPWDGEEKEKKGGLDVKEPWG